ncbi:MAG: rhomboid family intramembrane serine protease [Spirochaetia bacterium]|nr:rhomboid family intramembrane serine protease [Spirochaetia bacterium]
MKYNFTNSTEDYKLNNSYFAIKIKSKREEKEFGAYLGAANIPYKTIFRGMNLFFVFHEKDYDNVKKEREHYYKEKNAQKINIRQRVTNTVYPFHNAIIISLLLLFFHLIVRKGGLFSKWFSAGAAHSQKIISGEILRTVSALTLHGDMKHLFGNITAIIAFAPLLSRETGSGWGWILILFSGILGNYFNALFHYSLNHQPHLSIGASTSIFGILGILASIRIRSGWQTDNKFREAFLVPIFALLALLAIMGISGQNTDIFAHLFGMISGVLLGIFLMRYHSKRTNILFQSICWIFFFLIILLSWIIVFA